MEKMSFEQVNTPDLKFAHLAPKIWEALGSYELRRSGWVKRGVKNPETVQEHTTSLRDLAFSLFNEITSDERRDLLDMLELHDWAEAVVGDEIIVTENVEDRAQLKKDKMQREFDAMVEICEGVGGATGDRMLELWTRFETSPDDPAAVFGRQLDKYQAIERALDYEKTQNIPLFREFKDYAERAGQITHPVLLKKLEDLENEWKLIAR